MEDVGDVKYEVPEEKFDVAEFCRKLRASKRPPYKCPLAECSKVYRTMWGLQHHLTSYDHSTASSPPKTPTSGSPGRKKGRWSKNNRSPVTAQLLDTPAVTSLTYAEAQNMVEFDLDGRLTRVNIHEELEVHSIGGSRRPGVIEKQLDVKPPPDMQVAVPQAKPYLPEPLFRIIDSYVLKDAPPMPTSYIRFVERPAEEMDADVEYEMDEQDCAWLDLVNEARQEKGLEKVSDDDFELLMDRLEKESYFQVQRRNKSNEADDPPVGDDDAVCCICTGGECNASNAILFCDMCNLAVHQDCYGVPYIPEGQWLCRRCLQSPSRAVSCILCPNKGGAFKQTDKGAWVHVVCALWIPEVRFANPVFLEPVDSVELIPMARWKLTCYLCRKRRVGTCIQCHKTNCYMPFHVSCAQQAGLHMKMTKSYSGSTMEPGSATIQRTVYCGTHSPGLGSSDQSLQATPSGSQEVRRPVNKKLFSTSISVPTIPLDRIQEIASLVNIEKKGYFILRVIAYWSLKRQVHNGVPLLRRLQVSNTAHSAELQQAFKKIGTADSKEVVQVTRLRQNMERARLLCELLRKRERLKASFFVVAERVVDLQLDPFVCFLRRLWELIEACDTYRIFSQPVDTAVVAGYMDVVKMPMDLATMRRKLEDHQYPSLDAFVDDFKLMINNCMNFNARNTVYYKAAVKMRDKCAPILSQVYLDFEASLIDPETGTFLPLPGEEREDKVDVQGPAPGMQAIMELCTPTTLEKIQVQVTAILEVSKTQPSSEDITQLQRLLSSAEALPGGPGRSKMIRVIKTHMKTARRRLTMSTSPRSANGQRSKQKGHVSRPASSKKTDAVAK